MAVSDYEVKSRPYNLTLYSRIIKLIYTHVTKYSITIKFLENCSIFIDIKIINEFTDKNLSSTSISSMMSYPLVILLVSFIPKNYCHQ
jgi:hypothetical protein